MKATTLGNAVILTSTLKLDDIKKVKKYNPDALQLLGGEDGKDPIFGFGVAEGPGRVGKFGIEFSTTPNAEGKAIVTLMLQEGEVEPGNVKEYIADKIGSALIMANQIEAKVPQAVAEIDRQVASIMDSIIVAG